LCHTAFQTLVDKISEDEIFRSVQDMLEAEQMMEVNGGCDVDDNTIDPKPSRKELRKLSWWGSPSETMLPT
jgi:hypothetical protein